VPPGLGWSGFALAFAAVGVGGVVQGSIGFGFALVAAPVLAIVSPAALPTTLLLLGAPLNAFMAVRERGSADLSGVRSILGGRVAGTVAGAALLAGVPARSLSALFGTLVLLAVALSAFRADAALIRAQPPLRFAAGAISGIMATSGAVGGPALALVYQDKPGAVLRSTLAVMFLVGLTVSLAALALAGKVTADQVALSLWLFPALAVGVLASPAATRRVDGRPLRPTVLVFSVASAVFAIGKGIAG
jgi:uncharacterized protein